MSDDHERHNRAFWDSDADAYQAAHGQQLDAKPMAWGVWGVAEAELGTLGEVEGHDVLELGCGAAQWSIALAAAGARPVGLDQSAGQLRHARKQLERTAVALPLVLATAEAIPLRDASFDTVFCDHGAMSFCDPDRIVPEVARLLRPGGLLVFNKTTILVYLTYDEKRDRQGRKLRAPYFGMRRVDSGDGTIDFQLPYGEWIRLFRRNGFVIEDLVELRPPAGATTTYDDFAPSKWARRWPAEEIWKVRRQ
jgi:SAM-dependent methyltransferase